MKVNVSKSTTIALVALALTQIILLIVHNNRKPAISGKVSSDSVGATISKKTVEKGDWPRSAEMPSKHRDKSSFRQRTRRPTPNSTAQIERLRRRIEWSEGEGKLKLVNEYLAYLKPVLPVALDQQRLKELLLARLTSPEEARKIAEQQQLPTKSVVAAVSLAAKDVDADLQAMLGYAGMNRLSEINRITLALGQVSATYRPLMQAEGASLSPGQEFKLAQAITNVDADSNGSGAVDSMADGFDRTTGHSNADRKLLSLSTAFLSSSQAKALSDYLATRTTNYMELYVHTKTGE